MQSKKFSSRHVRVILFLLGSKTLGTKCIRTSICNVLTNHDQNIESRFRLVQSVFICKI